MSHGLFNVNNTKMLGNWNVGFQFHGFIQHYEKSACIRIYSGPHFHAFGLNTERYFVFRYSVRMREIVDQNNSEYGHFLRSASSAIIIVVITIPNRTKKGYQVQTLY